jgi:hypothetical protein
MFRARATAISALLAVAVSSGGAMAQTASPDPQELLGKAAATILSAGSYHLTITWDISIPGTLDSITHSHGDVAVRPLGAHLYLHTHTTRFDGSSGAATQREQEVVAQGRVAVGGKGKRWTCARLRDPGVALGTLLPGVSATHRISLQTVGPDTVDGVAVWHVREVDAVSGSAHRATIDYYISQSESTLVEDVVTAQQTLNDEPVTETLTHHYSKYGEQVRFKLPTCPSK